MSVTLNAEILSLLKQSGINIQELTGISSSSTDSSEISSITITNTQDLIEILKLCDAESKYKILKRMTAHDLTCLMGLMDKTQLVAGLKFFTKDKLANMISQLPKKELTEVMLKIYSNKELIQFMDDTSLNEFMQSNKVDKTEICKMMQNMPQHQLAQVYEAATGKASNNQSQTELYDSISGLNKNKILDGINVLSTDERRDMANELTKNDKKLFQEFPEYGFTRAIKTTGKADLIGGSMALDQDKIVEMLGELPKKLMAQVVTQMDTEELADQLLKYEQNLITAVLSGN